MKLEVLVVVWFEGAKDIGNLPCLCARKEQEQVEEEDEEEDDEVEEEEEEDDDDEEEQQEVQEGEDSFNNFSSSVCIRCARICCIKWR